MAKRHLAALIAYGTEVRSFIYSGLLKELARDYRITVFTLKPDSRGFNGLPEDVEVLPLPLEEEPPLLATWRNRADRLHALWLEKLGTKRWRYTLPQQMHLDWRRKFRDLIMKSAGSPFTARLLFRWENLLGRTLGSNATWEEIFQTRGIDGIISLTYVNARALPALQTALNLGLKTLIFMHTWKEVFVKPHLAFQPSRIFVWNSMHAAKIAEFNPWIMPESIRVMGSLHLEPFVARSGLSSREEFCRSEGLDPDRPFICYTAAGPKSVLREENLVAVLLEAIREGRFARKPQLLLRLNPMEDGSRFQELTAAYPQDLVLQAPRWEWFPEINWNCPLAADSRQWISTVYHAALNVSIPSTVTLEFAALNRPVVNVCFDLPAAPSPELSNERYWFTDWYADIRSLNLATPVFSPEELVEAVRIALDGGEGATDSERDGADLLWLHLRAATLSRDLINEVMA